MDFTQTTISRKLREIDPTLDIQGSDRKVLQLACQDCFNYLKFWQSTSKSKINFDKLSLEGSAEFEVFLGMWTAMWQKKWETRVKLIIGRQDAKDRSGFSQKLDQAEPMWQELDCKQELIGDVISTLINHGEICGTKIIAEHIVKLELSQSKNLKLANRNQALTFFDNVMRRARDMSQTTGPIIFVEVNKAYYNSAVSY